MAIIWDSEKESISGLEESNKITEERISTLEKSVSEGKGEPILIHRRFYRGFFSAGCVGGLKEERDYFEKGFILGNLQEGSFEEGYPGKDLFYLLDISERWENNLFLSYSMGGDFFIPVKNKMASFGNSFFDKIKNPKRGLLGIRKYELIHRGRFFEKEDIPYLSLFGIFIGKEEIENAPNFYGKDFYFLNFPPREEVHFFE